MPLKLVLFIDGVETYANCDYPPTKEGLAKIGTPTGVYVDINGLDKSENFPDNYPSIDDFEHEYRIMWKEDEDE